MRVLRTSKKRIGTLKASVVKEVEQRGEVKISIDKEGDVEIIGNDGGHEWIAEQVLKAILEGFLPPKAYKLFSDEVFLDIIDLDASFYRKDNQIGRAKSRIIGEGGSAKKKIEELTGTFINISSKNQVAIIGTFEDLKIAKEGLLRILEGAPHTSVYKYLENQNKKNKVFL